MKFPCSSRLALLVTAAAMCYRLINMLVIDYVYRILVPDSSGGFSGHTAGLFAVHVDEVAVASPM